MGERGPKPKPEPTLEEWKARALAAEARVSELTQRHYRALLCLGGEKADHAYGGAKSARRSDHG